MDGIILAKEIVSEVNKKVKRVYWTNEEIDRWFGRRSIGEIIRNETTCFMNPCLDLTLVSSYLLSQKEIPHEIVIEEHSPTKDFNFDKSNLVVKDFPFRVHFKIDFQYLNKNYSLNYKRENEVEIIEGKYNGREDIPNAQIIRVSGEKINPHKTLNENLRYNTLDDLIKSKFIGFSLEKNLNQLKQDNSEENYRFYKKRCGEDFNIITTS